MILGMPTFTFVHVLISVIGIGSGLIALYGMLTSDRMDTMTAVFLLFTALTTITGFFFPFHAVTPAFILGIISAVVLILTLLVRYAYGMAGLRRPVYVIGAVAALYFNCFVFVVQAFQKIGPLHMLAPNGSEPPFAMVQGLVLLFFIVTGFLAVRRFHPR